MIHWIASYPRSGNTLVRTLLKQCFGVDSFERELSGKRLLSAAVHDLIGHRFIEQTGARDWEDFYREASRTAEPVFVKTHRPPEDDQPAIYVLRSGRAAVLSYFDYLGWAFPDAGRSLVDLIVGNDSYGDWTSHYRSWAPDRRPGTMILRYEALLEERPAGRPHSASGGPAARRSAEETATASFPREPDREIARLAAFLPLAARPLPWRNPFDRLRELEPRFFRRGRATWVSDPRWTKPVEQLFLACHGSLMEQLGYASPEEEAFAGSDGGH